ncbi:MAG: endonuclease/exonuclease/phosphatase family protein [Bacteroidota bacterium]|nr:endonuclease/exonuclease/phosphatase family protein [Bacteroidota bacterium]
MKKILKILLYLVVLLVILFGVFLLYATINDFKPDPRITLYENDSPDAINDTSVINLMIWNIGYCGLSQEMDFFYDGGENVRATKTSTVNNLSGVSKFLSNQKETDIFLLQEVDKEAKRSWSMNQYDSIAALYPAYTPIFGVNYDVFFVPQPLSEPMGKVLGGLMTLSRYKVSRTVRHSFPGNYSWPVGLFFLDRCFMVNRYPLNNQKELLVINTHNSAYDDGSLRKQQMDFLENFLSEEYAKGNYIIVGGDWNQSPPNFKNNFADNIMDNENRSDISAEYLSDWNWVYNSNVPTNRRVATPYKKGKSLTTVIDYFLLSPNIELLKSENIDLNFEYSDHQPVKISIKLKTPAN